MIAAAIGSILLIILVNTGFSGSAGKKFTGATTGAIEGHVTFKGIAPKAEEIKVTRDHEACGVHKKSEEFVVNTKGGLKNVVFRLELMGAAAKSAGNARREISLEQKGCTYIPHVQTATIGSKLNIINEDPVFHNVHALFVKNEDQKETLFNIPQIPGSDLARQSQILEKAGVYEFICDVHPWMKSFIIVHDNNFVAATDENGYYVLPQIPPGVHKLKIWHEALGESERTVIVPAGKTLTIDLPIEPNE